MTTTPPAISSSRPIRGRNHLHEPWISGTAYATATGYRIEYDNGDESEVDDDDDFRYSMSFGVRRLAFDV